jgi:hypothetical protein
MDAILQGIKNVDGVLGALAIGTAGQVVGHKVNPVYDLAMVEQLAAAVATTLDSLVLAQEDWDSVTANFADGRLLLRNLCVNGAPSPSGLRALVVIAESRINLSFAGVAIRVAVGKLKNLPAQSAAAAQLAASPSLASVNGTAMASSQGLGSSMNLQSASALAQSQPHNGSDLSSTGLSWSGASGSSMAASGVAVTDAASAAYLTTCTKALARSLGPMAKAFVKDAIRKQWPGRAFSLDLGPQLVSELERHIEDPGDRAQFRKAVKPL